MSKSSLLKNARNYAEYLRKKERGPVKAFFHITKNENVPAIEQQGLLTNHPNANVNSAAHPFRKHGTDAGGVWVTTEPTAFPVYGTTIGGKNGNSAARADALSTIKIEVPLPELSKMKAVQDPYGRNILRKGNDPRAVEKFPTWAGIDVPTTVLLNDVKPQWLKNIGYVEELNPKVPQTHFLPGLVYDDISNSSKMSVLFERLKANQARRAYESRGLNKADRNAISYVTGHDKFGARIGNADATRSPARFVEEYLDKNQPITKRLPVQPAGSTLGIWSTQFPSQRLDELIKRGKSPEFLPPTAEHWTYEFKPYTKQGELPKQTIFQPGAYSRGMGTIPIENIRMNMGDEIKNRHFNWNTYLNSLQAGMTPEGAASQASPSYYLDWDNIVYSPKSGYAPNKVWPENLVFKFNAGAISRGRPESLVRTDIDQPINLKQLSDVRKVSTKVGDAPKQYLIDRLNLTDAVASDVLKVIPKNATWADIVRAVMKANINSK